jgi:phytoene desaturase
MSTFISNTKISMILLAKRAFVYTNFPSLTDKTAAQKEWNLVFSYSISSALNSEELREEYFNKIMDRFERCL